MIKIIYILRLINKYSSLSLNYLKYISKKTNGDLNFFVCVVILSYEKKHKEIIDKTLKIEKIKKTSLFYPLKALRMKALFYNNSRKYITLYNLLHKNIHKMTLEARYFVEIIMKEIETKSRKIKTSKLLLNIEKDYYMQPYKYYYLGIISYKEKDYISSKDNLLKSLEISIKIPNPDISIESLLVLYKITKYDKYFYKALELVFYYFDLNHKMFRYYDHYIKRIKDKELKKINVYLSKKIKHQTLNILFNKKNYPNELNLKKDFDIKKPIYKFSQRIGISRATLSNIENKRVKKISSQTVKKLMTFFVGKKFNYIVHSEMVKDFIDVNRIEYDEKKVRRYLSFYLAMVFFSQDYNLLTKETINLLNNNLNYNNHNLGILEIAFINYIEKTPSLNGIFKIYTDFLNGFALEDLKHYFKIFFKLDNKEKTLITKFVRNIIRYRALDVKIKIDYKIPQFSNFKILSHLNLQEDYLYKAYSLLEDEEKNILLDIVSKKF
ncbi:MAG: hypothetical protein ACQESN_05865 [Thermotogota bacterium]